MSSMSWTSSDYKFIWESSNRKALDDLIRKYSNCCSSNNIHSDCRCITYIDEKCTCYKNKEMISMNRLAVKKIRPKILKETDNRQRYISQQGQCQELGTFSENENCDDGRKSCPDLLTPCLDDTDPRRKLNRHSDGFLTNTLKKKKENIVNGKPVQTWTHDDVMAWIQSIGLQELNSLFIGMNIFTCFNLGS